ncbi:MAG: cytochrome b/b6 domain-containing protein [Woeseiaceae bacterium]
MAERAHERILRHALADRLFHWVTAATTLTLLGTGFLPVFDVKFDWVPIHWICGVVLTVAVAFHMVRSLIWQRLADMWVRPREVGAALRALRSRIKGVPDDYRPGKYSLAQVLFHFAGAILILATIATGLMLLKGIESPFWQRDPYFVSESVRGWILVVHGVAALFLVTMIMLHVYFALRPEKLYFTRSMLLGWITRDEYGSNHDPRKWPEAGR